MAGRAFGRRSCRRRARALGAPELELHRRRAAVGHTADHRVRVTRIAGRSRPHTSVAAIHELKQRERRRRVRCRRASRRFTRPPPVRPCEQGPWAQSPLRLSKPLGQEYIDGEDDRERESPNARITHNDKRTTRIAWAPRNEPINAADVSSAPVRAVESSSRSCASARTATS